MERCDTAAETLALADAIILELPDDQLRTRPEVSLRLRRVSAHFKYGQTGLQAVNISTVVPLTNNTVNIVTGGRSSAANTTVLPDYTAFAPPALPINQLRYSIQQADQVHLHPSPPPPPPPSPPPSVHVHTHDGPISMFWRCEFTRTPADALSCRTEGNHLVQA